LKYCKLDKELIINENIEIIPFDEGLKLSSEFDLIRNLSKKLGKQLQIDAETQKRITEIQREKALVLLFCKSRTFLQVMKAHTLAKRAGIRKRIYPTLFRHLRATHLASNFILGCFGHLLCMLEKSKDSTLI
jgi:hypothetical protein